jgi:predicted MFS family arabinose efflux permease
MSNKKVFIVITSGALVVTISVGVRQAFGIFLQPISSDLGSGREAYSLAIALQNLILGLPLMAIVADRFGARPVVLGGGLLYGLGLLLLPMTTGVFGLYLTLGLLTGLALSSTTYAVALGAVARVVPPEKQSSAFGIATAAGSFGMFIVPPGAQALLSRFGWQTTFMLLAGFAGVIALLSFGFAGKPEPGRPDTGHDPPDSLPQILAKAGRHSGYRLLTIGFFVCGFHVAFIATHLPAFLTDNGVSPMAGATALALIGLFNIIGSYLFGLLGDRYRKKFLLSLLYLSRAVVISLFLLLPVSNPTALVFGGTIGFLWLATVPLTSGMVAQIFGSRYLSTLYGFVLLSHQIGSFLGVWLGGRVYDLTGSYFYVWLAAIGLGFIAAILHLPISDGSVVGKRYPRPNESVS